MPRVPTVIAGRRGLRSCLAAAGALAPGAAFAAGLHVPVHDAFDAAAFLVALAGAAVIGVRRWSRASAFAHLREVIEPMAEGVAFYDAQDRILVWNSRYAELVDPAGVLKPGRTFRELLEGNVRAGAHPDAAGREAAWVEARVAQRGEFGSDEHKNGDRWVRAERRPTRKGGLVTVVMDVTDLRMATEVMAQARDAAEAANRAKSEFLANVSHELRTPLNGVLGVAEVLIKTPLNDTQRDMVETIRASGGALDALVADIVELARLESGNVGAAREPFDLEDAVARASAAYRVQAERKGVGFVVDFGPGCTGVVEGDGGRLRQILGSLLSNAVKFTDAGEVRIRVERPTPGGPLVRFTVSDTGVGFDAEVKARIFERFQQGDASSTRRYGGTGLGLAICRQAARLLNGDLTCDSEPGRGSAFVLTLDLPPAGEAAPSEPAPAAGDRAAPDAKDHPALRVLVVDDHPTNRRVVEMILDQVGAERVSVENGKEALEAYLNDRFDVVLMDIQMPVMDGLTATQKIRLVERETQRPPTPVVILSANALPEHVEAGKAAGADRHLAKPVSAAALLNVIAEVASDTRAA